MQARIGKSANSILLNAPDIKKAHVGISIYDPSTKKYLFTNNGESNFIPASTTKLFTLYAGMKYLGDSLTGAFYRKNNDTLFLVPNADPSFMSKKFSVHPLLELIKKNESAICFVFPSDSIEPYGPGWAWDDQQEPYMPQRAIMPVYENQLKLIYGKKNNSDSSYSLVQMNTEVPGFSQTITYDSSRNFIQRKPGTNNITTTLNRKENEMEFNIPFETFGNKAAIQTLENLSYRKPSIRVDSDILYGNYLPLYSQASDSAFSIMMHQSDNFFAEQLLLMIAQSRLGKLHEKALIDTLLQNDFQDIPQKPRWVDGSGLSRYNLFSPNDEIYILDKLIREFGTDRLEQIFPTGGEGTMKNLFNKEAGFIFAKTGSFGNTFCISGWMCDADKKPILFSVMVNQYIGKNKVLREAVESFLKHTRSMIQ
jgi:D-alanyl-D-alanine carboxypeptidase/D-alanyl-D-alanine-endopeptidase (penicillin-binding protein 4)